MARPRMYPNRAVKQKVYRSRLKEKEPKDERVYHWRLQRMHEVLKAAAEGGSQPAAEVVGVNAYDTALRMILLTQRPAEERDDEFSEWDLEPFKFAVTAYEMALGELARQQAGVGSAIVTVRPLGVTSPKRNVTRKADRPTADSSEKLSSGTGARRPRTKKPVRETPSPA